MASKEFGSLGKWVHKLATQGVPLLVLFTSKSLLLAVSERLRLPHLAQYKNGEAANIKRRFDRGESSILLGAGSFWEGTDFSSQKQMIEVITRIPFDNPSDFFTQKLNRKLRQEGKNPFYDYSLPVAILRIKQALGRTIRHQEQQSAVDEYYPATISTGISQTVVDKGEVASITYYALNGSRLNAPAKGISIRKITYSNGKTATDKVIK